MIKIKIKKGNTVKILSGNDRGKSGEVIKLFPKNFSAIVKGMNLNNKAKPVVKIDKKIKDKKKTIKKKTKSKKK